MPPRWGRLDGSVTAEEALEHAAAIVSATELPVSADLENGFADSAEGVAETSRGAVAAGLAGFSIEDFRGDDADPIYELELAAERVRAAAEVAHRAIISSVDLPVNVLVRPGSPPVAELAQLGVSRISVGGSFAFAAVDALVRAGRELLDEGTYGYAERSAAGARAAREAFR